jgi:hypothetical protein
MPTSTMEVASQTREAAATSLSASHGDRHDDTIARDPYAHTDSSSIEQPERWEPVGGGSDVFPLVRRRERNMSDMDHQ